MTNTERALRQVCGICQGPVDGAQLRKCVGLGASMLFYGLTKEQLNPALESMGEPPLRPDVRPDLRLWCGPCAEKILAKAPNGQGRGGECALCLERIRSHPEDVGLAVEPGCVLAWPGIDPKPLCLNCRIHVFFKEGRL